MRLGGLVGGLGVAYGLVFAWAVTVLALELATGALVAASSALGVLAAVEVQSGRAWVKPLHITLGAVGGVAYRGALGWSHTRRWVRPLHLALAPVVGVPRSARPRSWLTVPRDFHKEGREIVARLPDGFALAGEVNQRAISDIVCAKLALEQPGASWRLAGHGPTVTYKTQTPPPALVGLADIRGAIARGSDSKLTLGLGQGAREVACDFEFEPHVLVSAASGAGKSVAIRVLVSQALHHGAIVLCLDIKRISQSWLRGLPSVRYAKTIEQVHEALLWLEDEIPRRADLADQGADLDGEVDGVDLGPRIIILCEELNATAQQLAKYWRKIRSQDDPKISPAVEALGAVSYMGRQLKINLVVAGQMTSARALGGGEVRESFGYRVLSRWSLNAWRMLAGEVWPPPRATRHKGRMQVVVAGQATEVQVAYLSAAEARELASSGTVAEFPAAGPADAAVPLHIARTLEPIGLREAIASGALPVPEGSTPERWLEAVRKARQYDAGFPAARDHSGPGGGHRYDPDELAAWARSRPRAGVA